MIQAQFESILDFTSPRCIITLTPIEDTVISDVLTFTTTLGDSMKNTKIEAKMSAALDSVSNQSNVDIRFSYEVATKMFKFIFPANDNIDLTLGVSPELASLLGYDPVTVEINSKSQSNPRPDTIDVKEAGELSRTLAFDTGLVIVEIDNISSNTTFGLDNQYMASLYPNQSGILTMSSSASDNSSSSSSSNKRPTISIPSFMTGSSLVPLQFQLLRFINDNTLVPLIWKTGAFVNGVLCGKQQQSM